MRHSDPRLPPLSSFLWLASAYVQCLLLHPQLRSPLARLARLALCPLTVALARQGAIHAFTPRETTRGWNVVWAFMCVYGAWKGVEWAVAGEDEYDWVGFGNERGAAKDEARARNAHAVEARDDAQSRERVGLLQAAFESLHLFTSFRMMGYRGYRGPLPATRHSPTNFALDTIAHATLSHFVILLGTAWFTSSHAYQHAVLFLVSPGLASHARVLDVVRTTVDWLALGFFVMSALSLLQSLFALSSLALHALNAILGAPLPLAPFDSRDWCSLFYRPLFPTSVQALWATHWHRLLRRPFQAGSGVVYKFVKRVTGNEVCARSAGLATVAVMTGFIHLYPLLCALDSLPTSDTTNPDWRVPYGAHVFFGWMALLTVLEKVFTLASGRRVKGVPGYLWAAVSVLPAIVYLLPPAWGQLGLGAGLPEPEKWRWERVWVPLGCVAPEPMWTQ